MFAHFILFFLLHSLLFNRSNANYVIKLDDGNFEHLTQASTGQTTGKWFINFHSPACGHCQNLAPIWSTFSEELKTLHEESGILVGSVDVKQNPILSERFGISALPTLLFFAEEGMFEYPPGNPRDVDEFIKFTVGDNAEYKKNKKQNVPRGPGGMLKLVGDLRKRVYDVELLRYLLDDVEHILMIRKNAAVLLIGIGIMIGFLFASLLALCRSSNAGAATGKSKSKKE